MEGMGATQAMGATATEATAMEATVMAMALEDMVGMVDWVVLDMAVLVLVDWVVLDMAVLVLAALVVPVLLEECPAPQAHQTPQAHQQALLVVVQQLGSQRLHRVRVFSAPPLVLLLQRVLAHRFWEGPPLPRRRLGGRSLARPPKQMVWTSTSFTMTSRHKMRTLWIWMRCTKTLLHRMTVVCRCRHTTTDIRQSA